jgi:anaerobic magnesium-protoporphyrin IX monomethyl ester cyclase
MRDVILINPATSFSELSDPLDDSVLPSYLPPLGILYLASVLESRGVPVHVVDMQTERNPKERIRTLLESCEFVGITGTTPAYKKGAELAGFVKSVNSDIPVVMGGPHVTFTPEETLREGNVDIVVRREGEVTILDLYDYFAHQKGTLNQIKGISFLADGNCVSTPDRPFIEDLDALPFPARHLVNISAYIYSGNIITGRGCPYKCQFCACGPLSGYRYRTRTVDNVIAEIQQLYETMGISTLFFSDDTFTANRDRLLSLCRRLSNLEVPPRWICTTRVNTIDVEMLKEMKKAGCFKIQYGVESGSDRVLKNIQKQITVKMVEKIVKRTLEEGISVVCSFVIGHPDDDVESIQETFKFAEALSQLGDCRYEMGVATPFPGTALYEQTEELGIEILSRDWDRYDLIDPVIHTKNLDPHQLRNFIFGYMIQRGQIVSEGGL